ncbi:hypothetical protein HAZT_HAZT006668 [Hyalella azteca]|uniref:Neurotransmitter-gated ion-channel transmembrane domain-containing protein n=1 Tax=Hyalella azteca TaxID=294128 RepID=A0A6A0H9Y9_HYAAZ|nr:hypothetical protein HAZT_HAZT006668 [Hyalella azteca]
MLSLTVFMTLVAEQLPQVSDAIPLLEFSSCFHCVAATYFNCIMFMVASSVVLTVVVLNYHHRSPTTHTMPDWVSSSDHRWAGGADCFTSVAPMAIENAAAAQENYQKNHRLEQQDERVGLERKVFQISIGKCT